MKEYLRNEKGFVGLISLLLAIAIICYIGYKAYGTYLLKPRTDARTKQTLSASGIDASSDVSSFQSMKERIKEVNTATGERFNQVEQMP